jgi:hypothetical protein
VRGRLVLSWTSGPVAALPRSAQSRRVSYRFADLIVECGPAGTFGGNAPAWPAPQNGGRSSGQPGDRTSDRHCEREPDGNAPERAGESWQRMSACASRFEHVELARVDGPRARRVAAELASAGASPHFGCFVECAPTPPGEGAGEGRARSVISLRSCLAARGLAQSEAWDRGAAAGRGRV